MILFVLTILFAFVMVNPEELSEHLQKSGDSIRGMLPYIDEIPLADMVDLAGFAQTLPRLPWTREELAEVEKANALRKEEREKERLKEKAGSP